MPIWIWRAPVVKSGRRYSEVEWEKLDVLENVRFSWCRGPESNWLRPPFQGGALPMSYPGTGGLEIVGGDAELCQFGEKHSANQCDESSNSFIQLRFLSTSRGLVPSGGPTMPSFSMRSIRRAARP